MNKSQEAFVVDLRPVRSERLSPREYLRTQKERPGTIEKAEFILPRLGEKGFGHFMVRYRRPIHKMA